MMNGDSINPAHDMLLFDCHELIERKRYMQCVLTVAQAYEVFFNHFLHVQVLYRAFARGGDDDQGELRGVSGTGYAMSKLN
jgi:hypothetical protein